MSTSKPAPESPDSEVSRRTLFKGAAILAAGLAGGRAMAAEHDHSAMVGSNSPLIESALNCMRDGYACMQHLLVMLSAGNTALSDCVQGVNDMLAICDPLVKMASYQSPHLPALAALAAEISDDCEAVCRSHAAQHPICGTLADSCAACARECRAVAA